MNSCHHCSFSWLFSFTSTNLINCCILPGFPSKRSFVIFSRCSLNVSSEKRNRLFALLYSPRLCSCFRRPVHDSCLSFFACYSAFFCFLVPPLLLPFFQLDLASSLRLFQLLSRFNQTLITFICCLSFYLVSLSEFFSYVFLEPFDLLVLSSFHILLKQFLSGFSLLGSSPLPNSHISIFLFVLKFFSKLICTLIIHQSLPFYALLFIFLFHFYELYDFRFY